MPYDDRPIIIQLELRPDVRVLEFGKLRIPHRDESVLRIDIFDLSLDELRSAQQACVVQSDDGDRLIVAVREFDQPSARIEWHRIFHSLHASHRIENVVRYSDRVGDRLHAGSITHIVEPILITVADA